MAQIDETLEFFFYFGPIQFTLAISFHYLYTNIMQREWLKIKDEFEDPWGAYQGVPKVPKWPQDGSPNDQYWPFLDHWGPPAGLVPG